MNVESGYDFPVISEGDDRRVGPTLTEAQFGDTVIEEETVYEDVGGDWENGDRGAAIGTVRLSQFPTSVSGKVILRASFVFDDGETVEFAGLVPGDGSWQGKGRLGFRGGTGRFADRGGEIGVESVNPKRWG